MTTVTNPAAVLRAVGEIVVEDRPLPQPGAGQVQVAIGAVGICGSDVHYYEHGRIGDFVLNEPMVIGHESAGVITSVGEGVDPGPPPSFGPVALRVVGFRLMGAL
ncbi:alcohol dehydrogenase catalytic domain-containing protein, partial [Nesterenkonia massiliensis]|uniref:alcohol dehydrogenase catalytic domain-containing protein n=1 Tax=Nesterenkonia massiliensis TaxID=1232429 RepID=UPI0005CA4850